MRSILLGFLMLTSTTAMAKPIGLDELCGTLEVEKRLCVTAPCFQGFTLKHPTMPELKLTLDLQGDEELNSFLAVRDGKSVCVMGSAMNGEARVINARDADESGN